MNEPNQSLEEFLFEAALAKSSAEDRAAFLDGVCRDNPALRARLEVLLEGHFQAEGFLADGTKKVEPKPAPPPMAEDESASTFIGRYKLLEKIGEGGFGEVWMAEQKEPVKRRVALKIIKLGMDTKQVVARFEAERQALAMMDHPNIAKVLDGGATEMGRPYFVMELVQGVPITDFCDKNKLSAQERLKLFIPVCQAVQSAHQKGIIHRDLKPSNVLVGLNPGGSGFPKVIDFGVAKATSQKLTEKTLFTAHGMMVGTPAYMSPEQAEMSNLDVDTRADIYSLGALLYELLTGTPPFPEQRLRSAGYNEMQRIILEEQPVKPSTRLSTLQGEQRSIVARNRRASELTLGRAFSSDLDWIVMKCLEKDRARRYETANGLAHDIERHLRDEPITARPPSRLYEFQKTLRRHWVGFAAVAAVLVALGIGAAVSTMEAVRARRAEGEQSRLRVAEANQRAASQQSLYKSLLDQARATRLARKVGYRDRVFMLLQQAKALDVPEKNLADLRQEAVACLGDFVGLTPMTFTDFPTNVTGARLDPAGKLAAFGLKDCTIQLREMPSGRELARLPITNGIPWAFCLNSTGDELFAVVGPVVSNLTQSLPLRQICSWAREAGGRWRETENREVPGATKELFTTAAGVFDVVQDRATTLVVASINPGGPAEKAQLQIGDKIVGFAGVPVTNDLVLSNLLQKYSGQTTSIIVERSNQSIELTVTPEVDPTTKRMRLGVMLGVGRTLFRLFNVKTKSFVPGYELTSEFRKDEVFDFWVSGNGALLAVETWPQGAGVPSFLTDLNIYDWKTGGLSNQFHPIFQRGISLSEEGKYLACVGAEGEIYALPSVQRLSPPPFRRGRTKEPVINTPPTVEHIGRFGGTKGAEAAFSGNVAALAIWRQNCVHLLNLVSREVVGLLDEPEAVPNLLVFSSHGSALLTVSRSGARFYGLSTPEKLSLLGHTDMAGPIAFSPNGERLASVANRVVRVCDSMTGRILWETNDLPGFGQAVAYSADGQWLATGDWDTELVWIRDAHTGQRLLEIGTNGPGTTWSLQFSPDGRYLATATDPYGLRIWTIESGQADLGTNWPVAKLAKWWEQSGERDKWGANMSLAFSPDGRSLAFWGWNRTGGAPAGQLYVWDFDRTTQPREVASEIPARRQAESFTPDGHSLLTLAGAVVTLDVASGKRASHRNPEPGSAALCLSPDGSKLAIITTSGLGVDIQDPEKDKLLYLLPAEPGAIVWMAWSPDSRRLAVSRDNGNVAIWDLETVNQILAQLGLSP